MIDVLEFNTKCYVLTSVPFAQTSPLTIFDKILRSELHFNKDREHFIDASWNIKESNIKDIPLHEYKIKMHENILQYLEGY